jgi:hypothetical protein
VFTGAQTRSMGVAGFGRSGGAPVMILKEAVLS